MTSAAAQLDWTAELERTVVHSLATTFGLDFLLFKDRQGGDVDTVHNARQGVYATDAERQRREQLDAYDPESYHTHPNYIARGGRDKALQQAGQLHDSSRGKAMGAHEHRDLDHTISAHEIHHDGGRILAEMSGQDLANRDSNLQSIGRNINRTKQQLPVTQFIAQLDATIAQRDQDIQRREARLATMPQDTPQQQHAWREAQDALRKKKESVAQLREVDREQMLATDREARRAYDKAIDIQYYTSSKFLGRSAASAAKAGVSLGARQMLGMVLAELWFELRQQLPAMLARARDDFSLEGLIADMRKTLRNIWTRLKTRFKDFLVAFKDGLFGGVLASLTTTAFNIVATSGRTAVKLIRELWSHLVKAIKLIAFNPDDLPRVQLAQAVTGVLSLGVASVVGAMLHAQLAPVLNFPFGAELASFASALVTGLLTLALQYFVVHSAPMRKVWELLGRTPHGELLERLRADNAALDTYLEELARIEFGLDTDELLQLAQALEDSNNELQRNRILRQVVAERGIALPFTLGDQDSTRAWLVSIARA